MRKALASGISRAASGGDYTPRARRRNCKPGLKTSSSIAASWSYRLVNPGLQTWLITSGRKSYGNPVSQIGDSYRSTSVTPIVNRPGTHQDNNDKQCEPRRLAWAWRGRLPQIARPI